MYLSISCVSVCARACVRTRACGVSVERERETDRQTDRQTDTERDTERDREREDVLMTDTKHDTNYTVHLKF